MASNYVVAIPALLLALALWALFIYVVVLIVRALRKYLRSNQEGKSPPEQVKSLGAAGLEGLTQEYVAEALGVSRQAVSKWENGSSEPSTANLMALSRLYGLSVDELLHSAE